MQDTGVDLKIRADGCIQVGSLDAQKQAGKGIFGSGLLLCERAAVHHGAEPQCNEQPSGKERNGAAGTRRSGCRAGGGLQRKAAVRYGKGNSDRPGAHEVHAPGGVEPCRGRFGAADLRDGARTHPITINASSA